MRSGTEPPHSVVMRLAVRLGGVLLVSGAALVCPLVARGTTTVLYVDRTTAGCSDAGPGTAITPYCTIGKGVAKLAAGFTLYVGNGTYTETIKPAVSGTATARITISAWPGRHPVLDPASFGANISSRAYLTLSGFTFSGTKYDGVYVSGSHDITISGNTVTGAGHPVSGETAYGISIRSSSASVVSGNNVHDNHGTGILITSGSTGILVSGNAASFNADGFRRNANGINVVSEGNTLLRNVTHDNEDSGIQFYTGADDNLAALNVTYNNGDHGIDDLNVTGGRLIGNTVYRNCTTGINVEGTSGNYLVVNNVAVDNGVYPAYHGIACTRRAGNIGIWDSAPSSTTVDHNLVWLTKSGKMYAFGTTYTSLAAMHAATGQEAHGVQADPRFVSAGSWNLRLATGSAAIDRGNSGVSGEQSTDVTGRTRVDDPATGNTFAEGPRRYDDLGAYEYQP
ncbi:parallel beta-helix repeat protein [Kribbella jejuensis]|uniref:Parallel beta-helix repeat protein n=2 Tax=Kribbella jejuensis TaxID=236068 RepID=A0A542E986_9ACTN|nr:parallel beta-helix repeat protein [Kribbella jejuensis]